MAKSLDARVAKPEDLETALHAMTLLMRGSDYYRWLFSEPGAYLRGAPEFLRAGLSASISQGCLCIAGDYAGLVALLPPGLEVDGGADIERWLPFVDPQNLASLSRLSVQLADFKPDKPHFRVLTLGIDPLYHSAEVMKVLLDFVRYKIEGYALYWEITAAALVESYQREGGRVLGELQLENTPKVMAMWREPTKEKALGGPQA